MTYTARDTTTDCPYKRAEVLAQVYTKEIVGLIAAMRISPIPKTPEDITRNARRFADIITLAGYAFNDLDSLASAARRARFHEPLEQPKAVEPPQ